MQSSRDAIAYIHEGMYLNTNQAYLDMFGYESADELDGLPIMDMIDAESWRIQGGPCKCTRPANTPRNSVASPAMGGFSALMEFSPARIDGERCLRS